MDVARCVCGEFITFILLIKLELEFSYAELEMKIGEVDRSRAIFAHAANICNPDVYVNFWDKWKDFETEHGNEDTIREMLRAKGSCSSSAVIKITRRQI